MADQITALELLASKYVGKLDLHRKGTRELNIELYGHDTYDVVGFDFSTGRNHAFATAVEAFAWLDNKEGNK